ncbi:class I SAM-dependent methyltransferase [Paenibacillus sp. HW567]|uniref:class I SAM-dependent methyltransferase n=1 Tax=Paenibacillus sp. HW567 TaxID=1034769 RepID=UPI000361AF74|nr:class I SAM-dependent methyltransferase [Paenibacillus sp. HW567]
MEDYTDNRDSLWEQAAADQYSDNIALKIPGYQLQYDLMDTLLTALFKERIGPEVLAVGAGGGQEILTLARKHRDWKFSGLDTSKRMLLTAEKRIAEAGVENSVQLHHCELAAWENSRPFAAATCMLVLHFVKGRENKLAFLQKIAGQLEAGAPLFISAINGDVASPAWSLQMAGWRLHMLNHGIEQKDWERFEQSFGMTSYPLPAEEMELLLRQAGFTTVTRYFGSYLIDGWMAVKGGSAE